MTMYNAQNNESVDHIHSQLNKIIKLISDDEKIKKDISYKVSFAMGARAHGSSNMVFIGLVPWSQRSQSSQEIAADINKSLMRQVGLNARAIAISGATRDNGLKFTLTSSDSYDALYKKRSNLMKSCRRTKSSTSINAAYNNRQYTVTVNQRNASEITSVLQQSITWSQRIARQCGEPVLCGWPGLLCLLGCAS